MSIHRIAIATVAVLALSGLALAGPEGGPSPTPSAPTAPMPAPQKAAGEVKSVDPIQQKIVVSVNGKDMTFDTAGLNLGAEIKPGARVEVSYTGSKASAVSIKK